MRILFARHGESTANIKHVFSNTGYKHGLTRKGKHQAGDLSDKILKHYPDVKKIYCSPLKRAVETAQIVNKKINTDIEIDERLIEFFVGDLEGKCDIVSWNLFNRIWSEWTQNRNYSTAFSGGEGFFHIIERFKDFISDMDNKYRHNEFIICITHGGVLKTALPYLIGDFKMFENRIIENAEIVEVELINGGLKYLESKL